MSVQNEGLVEEFSLSSLFSTGADRGLVEIKFRGESIMITSEEARTVGLNIIRAAEAADADEIAVRALSEEVGIPVAQCAPMLSAMVRHRRKLFERDLKETRRVSVVESIIETRKDLS